MTKLQMTDLLVKDFKKMFPDSDKATISLLRKKLELLSYEDLKLLCSKLQVG